MTDKEMLSRLERPEGPADILLDTDTFNEIDDQFALSWILRSPDRFRLRAICAAPFFNAKSISPGDGMEKSYSEILRILDLAEMSELKKTVFRGSRSYLPSETEPVLSEAAERTVALSREYTPSHPLYIVAIGALTNVASAFLLSPEMKERTVVVWLGGHALTMPDTREFNMRQDVAAARIVFGCGVPLVQIPCRGVADRCITGESELRRFLSGKNPLADYLAENTIREVHGYTDCPTWTRVIWDVTAPAWLADKRFTASEVIPSPIPEYDGTYSTDPGRHPIRYVTSVNRDLIFEDLFRRLTAE